ncbi:hypothetical protein GT037_005119 [Alternaria burnsii]|uniref:Uncharacterized protein n=1 Tax=Alternaria burnsii TaxID=1187904 RepID=A0A8H7BCN2_9PLEO|nr:uncharacterized protein GT037_005119 [Alternaria burnsii]KAF7676907.1 hypothetical protein GT037_005119 [Alternaria burnsii]
MASRFVENLEEVPISHPHLNVSLDDILAEESRKRSSSQSSGSSETRRSGSSSTPSPTSPINTESKLKRAFTIGSKKDFLDQALEETSLSPDKRRTVSCCRLGDDRTIIRTSLSRHSIAWSLAPRTARAPSLSSSSSPSSSLHSHDECFTRECRDGNYWLEHWAIKHQTVQGHLSRKTFVDLNDNIL